MATTSIAIPGQLLGPASKYKPGPGVHLYEKNLYSSVLGTVSIAQPSGTTSSSSTSTPSGPGPAKRISRITQTLAQAKAGGAPELPTVSVSRGAGRKQREVLPQVGNVVLCRVTRITPRQAVVAILVCGDTVLEAEWQGVIRVQDVRATEKDRVKIYESFRPGDIVRASVVSSLLSFFYAIPTHGFFARSGGSRVSTCYWSKWIADRWPGEQISLGDQSNYYLATTSNELGVIMAVSEAGNAMYPVSWKEYKDPETGLSESRKVAKPF